MEIHGFTDARFAPVRDAFCRNAADGVDDLTFSAGMPFAVRGGIQVFF